MESGCHCFVVALTWSPRSQSSSLTMSDKWLYQRFMAVSLGETPFHHDQDQIRVKDSQDLEHFPPNLQLESPVLWEGRMACLSVSALWKFLLWDILQGVWNNYHLSPFNLLLSSLKIPKSFSCSSCDLFSVPWSSFCFFSESVLVCQESLKYDA